jgi:hypothetical protein
MLAAFGLYLCVDGVRHNRRWTAKALAILGPALLLANFSTTLIWYPYQYVYLSEIARSFPQFSFDSETLGLSITEGIRRMREHGITRVRAGPAPIYAAYEAKQLGVAVEWLRRGQLVPGGGAYYVHTRPSWGAAGLPAYCRTLFRIERQGVILGVGGEC